MSNMTDKPKSTEELQKEIERLKGLLEEEQVLRQEAEETLEAIRTGAVDGIVRSTPEGEQVFILKGSDQPYRNLIEEMSEGALIVSNSGAILYCNSGFAKLVDAPLDKIIGRNIIDWVSQSSAETFSELLSRANKETDKKAYDIAFQTTKKGLIPTDVSINKILIGSINAKALIITDLTRHMSDEVKSYTTNLEHEVIKRKKAEEALKATESRFRLLFEHSLDAVLLTIPDGTILASNSAAQKMFEMTEEEIKKVGRQGVLVSDGRAENALKERAKTGRMHTELTYRRKDGSTFEGEVTSNLYKDSDGSIKTSMIIRDITERKKAEIALKEAQSKLQEYSIGLEKLVEERSEQIRIERERFFNMLENLPVMVSLITADYKVKFANRLFRENFGESKGRCCYEYVGCMNQPCSQCESLIPLQTGKSHHWTATFSNGMIVDAHDYPYTDVDGTKMILEADVDITERINLQKQLREKERLAAIGATAGMVGHDIRNPLQAITGDVYLLKDYLADIPEMPTKHEVTESLDEIEKNVGYINKIVADLQDYSRIITPEYRSLNLYELVVSAFRSIAIPENIDLLIEIDPKIKLKTDVTLFTRVISNLVINAIQAMPKGGQLLIVATQKQGIMTLSVEDTGVGIPEDVKPKLFTPMMTTKAKGQGLGLAVVKRLVEALRGVITFESQEGKGTKFIIELPLT